MASRSIKTVFHDFWSTVLTELSVCTFEKEVAILSVDRNKSKMTSARYAARYIGRYMARPALAEHKIIRYDGKMVTFWYIDHKTNRKVFKTLEAKEFIKLLIDHIPLKGFKMVRHYGLYGRRSKSISLKTLQLCKRFVQMSFDFVTGATRSKTWGQRMIESFGKDPLMFLKW